MNQIGSSQLEGSDATSPIVTCGNAGQKACRIDDLFLLANNVGDYVIKVVFPAVFFMGIIFTIYPILKDPNNPSNIAEAKSRALKLLIGTAFVLGSYFLVAAVLSSIGALDGGRLQRAISVSFLIDYFNLSSIPFVETASAQASFTNPISNPSIQNIILGIVNVLVFFVFIGVVLGIFRGVFLLMLGQESPDNLKKGKIWIIYSLLVAAIVFGAEMLYNVISSTVTAIFK